MIGRPVTYPLAADSRAQIRSPLYVYRPMHKDKVGDRAERSGSGGLDSGQNELTHNGLVTAPAEPLVWLRMQIEREIHRGQVSITTISGVSLAAWK